MKKRTIRKMNKGHRKESGYGIKEEAPKMGQEWRGPRCRNEANIERQMREKCARDVDTREEKQKKQKQQRGEVGDEESKKREKRKAEGRKKERAREYRN